MSVPVRCTNSNTLIVFLIGFLILTHATNSKAEICKWVDEDGSVHFAQTCPEDVQSTEVEIQPPPLPSQIDAASSRYADVNPQTSGHEENSSETDELLAAGTDQLRDYCIEARLSLDELSQKHPVYYDQTGKLRAEPHKSVRLEFDHSGKYLNKKKRADAIKHWKQVERDSCTPEIRDSGIRSEMKRKQKERQQKECVWWASELEYMERNKSFHKERLDLKKLFNANCK